MKKPNWRPKKSRHLLWSHRQWKKQALRWVRPSSTWHHHKPCLHEDLAPSLHTPGEATLDLACQFIWLLQVAHWIGIWLWPCSGLNKEQILDIPPLRKEGGVLFTLCIWQAHLIPWSVCHTEGKHLAGLSLGFWITSSTDLPLEPAFRNEKAGHTTGIAC